VGIGNPLLRSLVIVHTKPLRVYLDEHSVYVGEVVLRIEGIINELVNGRYVDRNSPTEEVKQAEARMEAQRKRLEKRLQRQRDEQPIPQQEA